MDGMMCDQLGRQPVGRFYFYLSNAKGSQPCIEDSLLTNLQKKVFYIIYGNNKREG